MPVIVKNKSAVANHFEAIFNSATTGILVTNSKGEIIIINPFALKEFGYKADELEGKRIEVLVPPRFREQHGQHHKNYTDKPQTRMMGSGLELFGQRKDGTEFPVEISLTTYERDDGKYVIAFITNIAAQKQAATEIVKLNTQLEAKVLQRTNDLNDTMEQLEISRDKLDVVQSFQKALLDNAGAMIIATDEKGIIKLFNPEAALNIGYSEKEMIDKHTPVSFHYKKEIEQKRAELLKEFGINCKGDFAVLVEKARRGIHKEEQYTYIRKDGTYFPVVLSITAIRNSNGEITGFMGVAIDISERKKAEEELMESLQKEKELNELKSRFVSMASHEFRTPLSTVLSSAYLIEKYANSEEQPKREKHLQRIVSSVNMLTDILNDFLSLGKIEEGKILVKQVPLNIEELAAAVSSELKHNLKKGQSIAYRHTGQPDVMMDASLLKHIIMNLVSNASKFSPEGAVIEMNTACSNRHISLSVKDRGIGISKDDQKHLMERFFRGKNAGNIQGTGLGLHIVSKYAELMNGTVECKSQLEKGTEFIIIFNTKTNSNEKNSVD